MRKMRNIHQLAFDLGPAAARKMTETKHEREIVDLIDEYLSVEMRSIYYTYSGFAMTMLPHKRIDDDKLWKRENGRLTLLVEPGAVLHNGEAIRYGVPYGSRARLIMFYLQTEAIRTRSPIVHLGSTMTRWMRNMNISTGGRNFEQVREQARRLSACRLTVGWVSESGYSGFRRENIVGQMIIPPAGKEGTYWEETAQLSDGFYQALLEHPVPCDGAAIRVLQSKSHAIDVYVWLCYRLHRLEKRTLVPWEALSAQFGHGYQNFRQFKWRFKLALDQALSVYKDAKIEMTDEGLYLLPSKPAVQPRNLYQVLLPSEQGREIIPSQVIEVSASSADIPA